MSRGKKQPYYWEGGRKKRPRAATWAKTAGAPHGQAHGARGGGWRGGERGGEGEGGEIHRWGGMGDDEFEGKSAEDIMEMVGNMTKAQREELKQRLLSDPEVARNLRLDCDLRNTWPQFAGQLRDAPDDESIYFR